YTIANTKTVAAAEAKYNIANIDYLKHRYKTSQKACFELVKDMPNYDYWVAKTYILLADDYVGLKDAFQAKATLQSIIDNYKGNDDVLPTAKQKLSQLTGKPMPAETTPPDSTQQNTKPDTTQTGGN
ncbi:MAG: tetratricopeptide repeat protein, partial [Mucilaginibacter sp.]